MSLHSLMAESFRSAGYVVKSVYDGSSAMQVLQAAGVDVCVMDERLPGSDGLEVIRQARQRGISLPVVLLSDGNQTERMAEGFAAGCDVCMPKPFSMRLLICQIEALLRLVGAGGDKEQTLFSIGGMPFDSIRQRLGERELSARESELLRLLCMGKGNPVERQWILHRLWASDDRFAARSLAVYITRLRSYLKDIEGIRILSVHGRGYKLVDTSSV